MSQNVEFNNQVFDKRQYKKNLDVSFKELGVSSIQDQIDNTPTINDFFQMYADLFYDIPETGNINSHEYLIEKSSNYINFEPNVEEIEALQNEIAQLRTELLNTQRQLVESQTGVSLDENNVPIITPTTTSPTTTGVSSGGSSGASSGGGY